MATTAPAVVVVPRRGELDAAMPIRPTKQAPPRVLLVAEGSYPVSWGGVSTWCDALIASLPEVPFHVLAIVAQPGLTPLFDPPPNLVETITVPLWNIRDIKESWSDATARSLHRDRSRTSDTAVVEHFVPPLRRFFRVLLDPSADPGTLASDIHAIYRFLVDHDLHEALHDESVWNMIVEEARDCYNQGTASGRPELRLWELTTGFQWLTRWLFPLAAPLPEVDVVHLAMAGICTMVAAAAKLEHGAGFLLTEHGVYLRERYLAETSRRDSLFLKLLALGFARRMTELSYRLADQISPCCDYNQRWELEAGADPHSLETIYYGLDRNEYRPDPKPDLEQQTVVWVGRINPLKDVETLLHAAAAVIRERPDVSFRLYGAAQAEDAEYHKRCMDLHAKLGLENAVEFRGHTNTPAVAYAEGDMVVLSSVSEGFPFSILEAMLCGRPVVATAVGGIPEQIEGAGIAVEPRSPEAMAAGILTLLDNPGLARSMGAAARERASTEFTAERFSGTHYSSYLRLSPSHPHWRPSPAPQPAIPSESGSDADRVEQPDALHALADDVGSRTWLPVDHLEVSAIIESTGVTDAVARERYGFPDTFRLSEAVLQILRERDPVPKSLSPSMRLEGLAPTDKTLASWDRSNAASPFAGGLTKASTGGWHARLRARHAPDRPTGRFDTARHPSLALLPTVALLTAIFSFARFSDWGPGQVLALAVGFTTGMVCATGIAMSLVPRGSSLVSLAKLDAARRFLTRGVAVAFGFTALAVSAMAIPSWSGLEFIADNRATFVVAALALSAIWTLGTLLSLVFASGWTGVALTVGVLLGVGLDRLLVLVTPIHLEISAAAGVLTVIGLMVLGLDRGLTARAGDRPSKDTTLPSVGFIALEGLPYFVYGTLAVSMFFSIHLIGWVHLGYDAPQVMTLELGLFLPLAPVVLALGTAERGMRSFWEETRMLQATVPAASPERFGASLHGVFVRNTKRYVFSLVVISMITIVVVRMLLQTEPFERIGPQGDTENIWILFVSGLVAYAIFGWAQLNGSYCLSLGRWRRPIWAVAAGTAVTVIVGVVVVNQFGYQWLGIALACGAVVYGVVALRAARRIIASADYFYITVV